MIIIPGQDGTYRHLRSRVTGLLADSGLNDYLVRGYVLVANATSKENSTTPDRPLRWIRSSPNSRPRSAQAAHHRRS